MLSICDQKFGRLRASKTEEGSWLPINRNPIAQTQRRVAARKQVLKKQYRAATLIGLVYLVGTIPMVLVSPASMQLRRSSDRFKIL
ncbi:hypothetical protein C7U65_12050 [Bradyrhizobium sp. WBAH23]|nr:hypothetical protein [Bradyrhizobium sp. WBAH41]MDD1556355.1 hypothetical protein [Bradyrhizobium sp. WBAH23]MDD1561804.1 hypothetical protein [Bradyrhizobium sp. WBAH33]NRB87672.1 hypothetical protein [Bradyrhizobium sp. WBAH10]